MIILSTWLGWSIMMLGVLIVLVSLLARFWHVKHDVIMDEAARRQFRKMEAKDARKHKGPETCPQCAGMGLYPVPRWARTSDEDEYVCTRCLGNGVIKV